MDTMARTGHKKAPRRNPPANEGRRYRLYPSGDADQVMIGWGHTRRAVRNLALEQRRIAWRHGRKTLRRDEQSSALTEARAEIDWIRDFPAQAGQQVLRQLDAAYDNWWDPEHPARAPTFEKRSSTLRFSLPGQAIELRRISKHWGEVRLPKIGWQRFRWSRSPGGLICNATFTKHAGSWYVAFGVATDRQPASKNAKPGCGVDFGVACSAYASDEDEPRTMQRSLTIGEERRLVGLERRKPRQVAFAKKHNHGRYSKRLDTCAGTSSGHLSDLCEVRSKRPGQQAGVWPDLRMRGMWAPGTRRQERRRGDRPASTTDHCRGTPGEAHGQAQAESWPQGQRRFREPPAGPWPSSIGCGMKPSPAIMSRSGNLRPEGRRGCQVAQGKKARRCAWSRST